MDLLEVEMANHTIHFHIDSQGTMKVLETFFTKHKCVAEGKRLLNSQQTHGIQQQGILELDTRSYWSARKRNRR